MTGWIALSPHTPDLLKANNPFQITKGVAIATPFCIRTPPAMPVVFLCKKEPLGFYREVPLERIASI